MLRLPVFSLPLLGLYWETWFSEHSPIASAVDLRASVILWQSTHSVRVLSLSLDWGVGRAKANLLTPAIILWQTGAQSHSTDSVARSSFSSSSKSLRSFEGWSLCDEPIPASWDQSIGVECRVFLLLSHSARGARLWQHGECGEGVRCAGWIIPGDRQRYEGRTALRLDITHWKNAGRVFIAFVLFGLQLPGPLMLRLMTTRVQRAGRGFVMNPESTPVHRSK